MLGEMTSWLKEQGVKHIYAACPNCYRVFRDYAKEFSIRSVYEHIGEKGFPVSAKISGNITVHDPCVIRKEKVSRSPFTYWNRLRLKKRLKKEEDIVISREREYFP